MSWLSSWGDSNSNTQTSQNPWAPAQPALNSILGGVGAMANNTGLTGAESGALGGLQNLASQGNPYTTGISGYANNMLAGGGANNNAPMVNDAYQDYLRKMNPTAAGQYTDPNTNPFFAQTTQTIGNDVQSRLQGLYAGSGRDPAGAGNFGGWLGRGIAEGTAPAYAQQYNQERTNQLNAQNSLYNAGNNTAGILGNFQNQFNQNQGAGVQGANAALTAQNSPYTQTLAIEAQRRGIPLSLMQQLAGIATPIAGLGGTGTSSTQNQASGMQQFLGLTQGLSNMFGGQGGGATGGGISSGQKIAAMMGG